MFERPPSALAGEPDQDAKPVNWFLTMAVAVIVCLMAFNGGVLVGMRTEHAKVHVYCSAPTFVRAN